MLIKEADWLVAGRTNCGFALEIAHILADCNDSEIAAFNVTSGHRITDLNTLRRNPAIFR